MTDARPADSLMGGPVSAALEADVRDWVRRHGIALWLDMADDYSGFVDRLRAARARGALPYEVLAFRGSHLALMFELERLAGGVEKSQLVVHLPGFNEESIKTTPLFELYAAGARYRKKLDTLVTEAAGGRVRREEIDAFKAQAPDRAGPSLDAADAWLTAQLDDREGGLSAQLRAMSLNAVVDDLLADGFVAQRLRGPTRGADAPVVWDRLDAWTGLHDAWRETSVPSGGAAPDDVAFAVSSWALCVEYVDDLKRDAESPRLAPARDLPAGVVTGARALAAHLRARHTEFYQRTADETESQLPDEVANARAEDLGDIDTFRFEEDKVLAAALSALGAGEWSTAAEWSTLRIGPDPGTGSFWVAQDPSRRSAWQLIEAAATLGLAIDRAGPSLDTRLGIDAAVERYVTEGAAVDRAHRQLAQSRRALLFPRLPQFERLRARLDDLRRHWRTWADAWARDFNAGCARHGFVPDASMQQRTLFDDVVRPMAQQPGITAYFVVDALRFEMAQSLFETLKDTPATNVHLTPRLAELPSVTEVGMNVLAPVCRAGKLRPSLAADKIQGFASGEFRVATPPTRKRAMADRVGGHDCPWLKLEEVLARTAASLENTVSRAKLVVVHSQEIDRQGEKGAGPAIFDIELQKLRAAWRLLRDAGVRRFVITADHGFLLLDDGSASAQSHGRKIDPKRRHIFTTVAADRAGEVRVPLASLGYEGTDAHVIFPETTAVFDTGRHDMSFVHGGNSLQERVIPVLTLVHRAPAGASAQSYRVESRAGEGVGGMHALTARVTMAAQGTLGFGGTRDVELSLTVVDAPGIEVELCQTRGAARVSGGAIIATVDESFELFFRLTGHSNARVRVQLEHPSAVVELEPCVLEARFDVEARSAVAPTPAAPQSPPTQSPPTQWLDELPEGGVRDLFDRLAAHGAVTAAEAAQLLGSPRA